MSAIDPAVREIARWLSAHPAGICDGRCHDCREAYPLAEQLLAQLADAGFTVVAPAPATEPVQLKGQTALEVTA